MTSEDFSTDILNFLLDYDIIIMAEYEHMEDVDYWEDLYNEGLLKAKKLNDKDMFTRIQNEIKVLKEKERRII